MDEAHNKLLERLRTYYGDDLACRMLLMDARHALEAMAGEVASLQNTFDLMWAADMRAIKLWQAATGRDHVWPDRAKTTLWLLERLDAAEAERDRLKAALDQAGDAICDVFEQMVKGSWQDDMGHLVMNNTAMLQLKDVLAVFIARKALGDAS